MSIRSLQGHWRDQYDRMRRTRARLDERYESSFPYDDAFYHSAQDIWHLKDWINGDTALPGGLRRRINEDVHAEIAILIIADIANCTKHLVLDSPKAGAAMVSTNSEVTLPDRTMIRRIDVLLSDGTTRSGTDLLDDAIRVWDDLLERHGLL